MRQMSRRNPLFSIVRPSECMIDARTWTTTPGCRRTRKQASFARQLLDERVNIALDIPLINAVQPTYISKELACLEWYEQLRLHFKLFHLFTCQRLETTFVWKRKKYFIKTMPSWHWAWLWMAIINTSRRKMVIWIWTESKAWNNHWVFPSVLMRSMKPMSRWAPATTGANKATPETALYLYWSRWRNQKTSIKTTIRKDKTMLKISISRYDHL